MSYMTSMTSYFSLHFSSVLSMGSGQSPLVTHCQTFWCNL